jgi:hypothetical protein
MQTLRGDRASKASELKKRWVLLGADVTYVDRRCTPRMSELSSRDVQWLELPSTVHSVDLVDPERLIAASIRRPICIRDMRRVLGQSRRQGEVKGISDIASCKNATGNGMEWLAC